MIINCRQRWLISSLFFVFTAPNVLLVKGDGPSSLLALFHGGREEIQTQNQNNYDVGSVSILKDRPSLQEKLNSPLWTPAPLSPTVNNEEQDNGVSCAHADEDLEVISDAIKRTLHFYDAHIDQMNIVDSAIGLQVLEGVLQHISNKSDNNLYHPLLKRLPPLINRIVDQAVKAESVPILKTQIEAVGKDTEIWKRSFVDWKCPSVINSRKVEFQTVGYEKETVWGLLNGQCQAALISRCDVPYACQRTFLDPEPQSQYMLTHQALYLILAKQKSCDQKHPEVFKDLEATLDRQCSKIYQEAELIAQNGFPLWARDLFSESIAICGFAGYPNFLRRSWVQQVLSWQSPNELGCFIDIPNKSFVSSDKGIPLPQLSNLNSTLSTTEKVICLPHFTSVSLTSLAVQLAYFFDRCRTIMNV